MDEQELPAMKVMQNYHYVGSFILLLMTFDRGKWSDIIGWFVTMKCWIIVVYSKAWVSCNCNHDEVGIMTIIGPFLDGSS
jgi:hypothetical protein